MCFFNDDVRMNGGLEGIWKEIAISQLKISFGTCLYEVKKSDVESLNDPIWRNRGEEFILLRIAVERRSSYRTAILKLQKLKKCRHTVKYCVTGNTTRVLFQSHYRP